MTKQDLIADIDTVIAEMSADGRPPPVNWVLQEMLRRHPAPPDLHPLIRDGSIAGFRLMIRRRLGLPEEEIDPEPEPELTPEELCAQAQRLFAHADELRRYARERTPPC